MQFYRIRFKNESDRAKAVVDLARRARIVGLPDLVYEVSHRGRQILDELGYAYDVIDSEGFDGLVDTVRSAAAAKAQ